MRIKSRQLLEAIGFDMTPMIDCVFQLIVFFMLVTDFANPMSAVELPSAKNAQEDKTPPDERLMVELVHEAPGGVCGNLIYDSSKNLVEPCCEDDHWRIKVERKYITPSQLEAYLIIEGSKFPGRLPPRKNEKIGLSLRPLMIRSDAGAVYQMVEKVFAACARARIYKIEIGARKPPGND
ncbi:MAG: biopolymer transporter ExbD [Planctomycetes bacterium]|nr:biopolymer transporter ExbD [Planctomycetota bacterium]